MTSQGLSWSDSESTQKSWPSGAPDPARPPPASPTARARRARRRRRTVVARRRASSTAAGHGEDPRVAGRDHRHPGARRRPARSAWRGALGLDPVVAARGGAARRARARGRGRCRSRRARRRRRARPAPRASATAGPAGPSPTTTTTPPRVRSAAARARPTAAGHEQRATCTARSPASTSAQRRDALLAGAWPARRTRRARRRPAALDRVAHPVERRGRASCTTAASVAAQPRGEHVGRQRSRQHGRARRRAWPAACPRPRPRALNDGHARDHLGRVARRQALVHVHVGAVEERVALAQHGHVAAGVEVGGEPRGARRRRSRAARPRSRRDGRSPRWSPGRSSAHLDLVRRAGTARRSRRATLRPCRAIG